MKHLPAVVGSPAIQVETCYAAIGCTPLDPEGGREGGREEGAR